MNKFTNVKDFISWVEKQKRFSKKVSLDKMKYYCQLFDNPQDKFKSIHVTGTNGKGSTVAFITSIMRTAGLNIATFTSPYITYFNERIEYNGEFISDVNLLKYANMIIEKYDTIELSKVELPSFFEFITLLAFLYFSELKDLDYAIIEVGMGGRLDSTNVITSEIAVISNIAYDHMSVLGNTLEKIALEKLGIVKNNEPLVIGIKDQKLQSFVKTYCDNRNIPLTTALNRPFEIKKSTIYGTELIIEGFEQPVVIGLAGNHQVENALTAIMTVEEFCKIHPELQSKLLRSIIPGLRNAKWPGRLEIVSKSPLILIDGAHNIDGITRVCDFIKNQSFAFKRAVVSISKDKDKDQMIEKLDQTFDEIIFTRYSYNRSAPAEELFSLSNSHNKIIMNSLDDALQYVKNHPADLTVFLGSLYLVCDIRNKINN